MLLLLGASFLPAISLTAELLTCPRAARGGAVLRVVGSHGAVRIQAADGQHAGSPSVERTRRAAAREQFFTLIARRNDNALDGQIK